jgi:hypothetical protein
VRDLLADADLFDLRGVDATLQLLFSCLCCALPRFANLCLRAVHYTVRDTGTQDCENS